MKMGVGEGKKKRVILGGPAEGGPAEGGPNRPGHPKIGLATENPPGHGPNQPRQRGWSKLAQIGLARPKSAQIGHFKIVAKIGQAVSKVGLAKEGCGKTRSWPK